MFQSNNIKLLLGIKDKYITIESIETIIENRNEITIISASLKQEVSRCTQCGCAAFEDEKKMIVKNGSKSSRILMRDTSVHKTYLDLKKQRFHCKNCNCYFTSESKLVNRHCFISNQVKFSILELLNEKIAANCIAKMCRVSWSTVKRTIESLTPYLTKNKNWLPKVLMVDEFRSIKNLEGKMSFICADGDTGKLFDILPSRRLQYISQYFNSFTYEARKNVQYIVTDMNASYFELIGRCFPNAKVIVDRFHIVQHINRQFNKVRIRVMKSLNQKDFNQAKQYRQLKSLYKYLLKSRDKLDFTTFRKWKNFKGTFLTETEVVHRLLSISNELKTAYNYYQDLLYSLKSKDVERFFGLIKQLPNELPSELKHIRKAFLKYEDGIRLAMQLPYSNGKIENKNTHIKTLKRISYGFKNFSNMKVRIFLLNNLIKIS